jgi:hypothetical protein
MLFKIVCSGGLLEAVERYIHYFLSQLYRQILKRCSIISCCLAISNLNG